jgi:hypothetical protein
METLEEIKKRILQKEKPVIRLRKAEVHRPFGYYGTLVRNFKNMPLPPRDQYSYYGPNRIRIHFKGHINIYVDLVDIEHYLKPEAYTWDNRVLEIIRDHQY